jgi:RNA polymerase sigma factor (sigma-70 family)
MTRDSGSLAKSTVPEEAASGHSRTIEEQLARWNQLLRKLTGRYGLSESECDELTQDIRIRIWRAMEKPGERKGAMASSYMYAAVMSATMDLLRRRRRKRDVSLEVADADQRAAPVMVVESDLVDALERALQAVPVSRRAAVRLHLEGRELNEIRQLLGWSLPQARNQLYRGLADLRAVLADMGHT